MRYGVLVLSFLVALPVEASLITEIMYDVPGSDSGREWIEICADTSEIRLTDYYLREQETNHSIKEHKGGAVIPAGSCAVVADNPVSFLSDVPNYTGIVFDSAFSLSNSGEVLVVLDKDKNQIDSVTYNTSLGADGDGNSIHILNGTQSAGSATPGVFETISPATSTPETDKGDDDVATNNNPSTPDKPYEPIVTAKIILPETSAVAGAMTMFGVNTKTKENTPIEKATFTWNFGDGARATGRNVAHVYLSPGQYVVFVDVAIGEESVGTHTTVTVQPALISIPGVKSGLDGYIEIKNNASYELDLSMWSLAGGDKVFYIPKNSHILPKTSVKFFGSITGIKTTEDARLLYPNGLTASVYTAHDESPATPVKSAIPAVVTRAPVDTAKPPASVFVKNEVDLADGEDSGVLESAPRNSALIVKSGDSNMLWYVIFVALVGLAFSALYFLPKKHSIVDDFEIVE